MNDQQLEAAARHTCKLLGMDPDDEAYRWVPEEQCEVRAKNWVFFIEKVREHWAIHESLVKLMWDEQTKEFDKLMGKSD